MSDPREKHLYVAKTPHTGNGLFTRRAFEHHESVFILRGELRFFAGRTREEVHRYENWVGLGRDRWIDPAPPFIYLNHSCEPNLGIAGEKEFVALRDIKADEELTFDYAITEDELPWTLNCLCGTQSCRGTITAIQLLPTHVLNRYKPYVNPYFLRLHCEYVDAQTRKRA
jgi:hypothetical protein